MTIYELNRHMEWFKQKDDSLWHKIAVMSSILIQPHVKKRIKPQDLIKIGEDVRKPEMSKEQIAEAVERLEAIYIERMSNAS